MEQILFFGIGVIIGIIFGWWIWKKSGLTRGAGSGMVELNKKRAEEKERGKEKILEMLKEKGEITNDDAQRALSKSDATITEYFDDLEREGKVSQVEKKGGL